MPDKAPEAEAREFAVAFRAFLDWINTSAHGEERNEVLQGLGKRFDIKPASYSLALERDDWLVIACDGLHAHVDGATLQEVLNEEGRSARQLAQYLVDLANQLG